MQATPDWVEGGRLVETGRGATWALRVADTPAAMLRWYRRGGLPSRIAREAFVRRGLPRPLRELIVTEEARARGIPVPEVLAARVDRLGYRRYRGAIVTAEIEDGTALSTLLGRVAEAEQRALLEATARVIRRMHDRGLAHPDLNAGNVLLCRRGDGIEGWIIDLDRARLLPSVSARHRRRALRRLERSLARVGGVTVAAVAAMQVAYRETR